jgi:hypothetical protein
MPPKKQVKSKKNKINKRGGGDSENQPYTTTNFTSAAQIPTNVSRLSGSSPRLSEDQYNVPETKTLFTPKSSSSMSARLLSVPTTAATAATAVASAVKSDNGSSFVRYIIIFIILSFLALSLFLYLEKPVGKSITSIYDPIINFFKKDNQADAVNKLEKIIDEKKIVNNIDKTENNAELAESSTSAQKKKYKKKPVVIPEADDSTSRLQTKPTSKAGFCYIGEDRGFRSCIEVGEGDVCMSGDIFPTQDICINPNLRE